MTDKLGAAEILGRNLLRCRLQRQMSVTKLAQLAGVSKATVLAIELGNANPTIETVQSLANVMDLRIENLLAQTERPMAVVRRLKDAHWENYREQQWRPLGTLYGSEVVYIFSGKVFEKGYVSEPHEPGAVETLYVISGRIVSGPEDDPVELGPGDWIRFAADGPHVLHSIGGEAEVLFVVGRRQVPDQQSAPHA